MARQTQYFPSTPGPQQPDKYGGQVGPHYKQYGEQQGWLYYPPTDSYFLDPNFAHQFGEQNHLIPKKPSEFGQLGPIAAATGAAALGQTLFTHPGEFLGGIKNGVQGLLGLGSGPAAVPGAAAPTASGAAPGLLNIGASAGAAPAAPDLVGAGFAPSAPSLVGSGADAATTGGTGLLGLGGASPLLGAAGLAAGAATAYESLGGIRDALGGNKLSFPEQAALALPTFGLSFLSNSLLGNSDKWKEEKSSLADLQDKGVYVPQTLIDSMPLHGRSTEDLLRNDLPADFIGRDPNGNWVNNKFASSRNVTDLHPEDIVNYSAFAEQDPDWFKKSMQERLSIAQQALAAQAVDEHSGTISVDFDKLPSAGLLNPVQDPGRFA